MIFTEGLGFKKAKVLINDRQLLKGIPYEAISAIDKIKKIGESGVLKEMEAKGIKKSDAKKYLKKVKGLKPNETIKTIFAYLEKSGFPKNWYEFEPTIARSFSYSSGPIWEIVIPEYKAGSVLGGERFDGLVKEVSGVSIPATGFAVGFDRTFEAALEQKLIPDIKTTTKVLVTIFNEKTLDASMDVLSLLRKAGINSEVYINADIPLKKQLKYADKKNVPFVVIIGPDEIVKQEVVLKDLGTKKQEKLPLTGLVARIRSSNS